MTLRGKKEVYFHTFRPEIVGRGGAQEEDVLCHWEEGLVNGAETRLQGL